jgi:hypothetical protein
MNIPDDPMARGGVGETHATTVVPASLASQGASCHPGPRGRAGSNGYGAQNACWGNGGEKMNNSRQSEGPGGVNPLRELPRVQRVALLVKALNGAKRTNEALARCTDGEEMLDVLLEASQRLGLGLSRNDLRNTPPIRDWVWWKNKEAVFTIGDAKPRYQQDGGQGRPPGLETAAPPEGESPRKKFLGLF